MDDEQIMDTLTADGYTVDLGDTIGGACIPDGTVRILDEDGYIVAMGDTLEEAYQSGFDYDEEPDVDEAQEWADFDPDC